MDPRTSIFASIKYFVSFLDSVVIRKQNEITYSEAKLIFYLQFVYKRSKRTIKYMPLAHNAKNEPVTTKQAVHSTISFNIAHGKKSNKCVCTDAQARDISK